MPTKVAAAQDYAAPAERVRAMLLDPDYARERALATGSISVDANVQDEHGTGVITIVRTLPAQMPDYARALVGETIEVTETQSWGPIEAGVSVGSYRVGFSGPVAMEGTMRLEQHEGPEGPTTSVRTEGAIRANVPFLGGKIESMVRDEVQRYLDREQELGSAWLSR